LWPATADKIASPLAETNSIALQLAEADSSLPAEEDVIASSRPAETDTIASRLEQADMIASWPAKAASWSAEANMISSRPTEEKHNCVVAGRGKLHTVLVRRGVEMPAGVIVVAAAAVTVAAAVTAT
jgi:hypothetical protein